MKIGFVGAGTVTGTFGRHLINAGHTIVVSNSRGPETLANFVADLGPRAIAVTMEQAAAWGLLAGVFNSIPYFGPVIVTGGTSVVAFLQFGDLRTAAIVGGVSLLITSLEGFLLTPWLTSRAGRMNAVAIFVGLLESYAAFSDSALKEVFVFSALIPILIWQSFTSASGIEEEIEEEGREGEA